MVYKIILTISLVLLSGFLGRAGGAGKSGQWYDWLLDTKWRDIGCPIILITTTILWFGYDTAKFWYYAAAGIFTFAALTTYWDELFGYDCLWFSGLVVGLAGLPLMWVSGDLWWMFPARILFLGTTWGLLHEFLPQKGVLCWRRDVAEENLRYMASL